MALGFWVSSRSDDSLQMTSQVHLSMGSELRSLDIRVKKVRAEVEIEPGKEGM